MFDSDDGGSTFILNFSKFLPDYMVSDHFRIPRIPKSYSIMTHYRPSRVQVAGFLNEYFPLFKFIN